MNRAIHKQTCTYKRKTTAAAATATAAMATEMVRKRTLTSTGAFVSKGPEKAVNVAAAAVPTTKRKSVSYTNLSLPFASQRSPLLNSLLLSVLSISFSSVISSFFWVTFVVFQLTSKEISCAVLFHAIRFLPFKVYGLEELGGCVPRFQFSLFLKSENIHYFIMLL